MSELIYCNIKWNFIVKQITFVVVSQSFNLKKKWKKKKEKGKSLTTYPYEELIDNIISDWFFYFIV